MTRLLECLREMAADDAVFLVDSAGGIRECSMREYLRLPAGEAERWTPRPTRQLAEFTAAVRRGRS